MPRDSYIELVGKTITVLETLRDSPEGLSLQELSARTGFVKSSTHRILQSLKKHGYIEQPRAGGPYCLGLELLILARSVNQGRNLLQLGPRYLVELVEAFGETAFLAILHKLQVFFVDVQESPQDLRLASPFTAKVHFHATAAGKVIAAFLPHDLQHTILLNLKLEKLTSKTIISRSQLEKEWESIRRSGYAINNEESFVGGVFLAAPIFDARHRVCGSISIGIPKSRYSAKLEKKMAPHLRQSCERLSKTLEATGFVHENDV
jgi:IclR family transcriptional regulator, KDG regulon repressor